MKKYTHYRVGLLIALLSLNTLSACLGIREKLHLNDRDEFGNLESTHVKRSKISIRRVVETVAAFGAGIFGTLIICSYFGNQSNATNPYINNASRIHGSSLTSVVPFISTLGHTTMMPYINIPPTHEPFVIRAIQQNPVGLDS